MVQKVFLALEGSGTDKKIDWPYVLISAATLWTGKKFKPLRTHESVKELFLDSGGFSFFSRYGEYPYTCLQLWRLARKLNANYVAIMDYPCEPGVNRELYQTNIERIERTIENGIKCLDLDGVNWVMVIQGYTVDEYLYAIDRIREQGLLTDVMAIGTLCTRRSISAAREAILAIRKALPGWVKLHGFGVDLRFLRNPVIFHALYSTDTGAWKGFMPMKEIEKLQYLEQYKMKLSAVMDFHSRQKRLVEVV